MRELSGLDSSIIPYALRHSSIVRGLRAGLPIRLVAALHDTSVEMIEKHYSAFIVDAMDELAAKAIVPLTSPPISHIRPLVPIKHGA
jgi:site-specific recombinase XerD